MVALFDHVNEYPAFPPLTLKSITPVDPPLQRIFVLTEDMVILGGSFIVKLN